MIDITAYYCWGTHRWICQCIDADGNPMWPPMYYKNLPAMREAWGYKIKFNNSERKGQYWPP